jgi:hypothetical protein
MTPPAADLPPEVKAFFGTWDGVLASRLVVEEIDATYARVVYAWGMTRRNASKVAGHASRPKYCLEARYNRGQT